MLFEETGSYLTHDKQKETRNLQIPSTNFQINPNYQTANDQTATPLYALFRILNIEFWVLFVIWDLAIVILFN
jgi:hypothetical protein